MTAAGDAERRSLSFAAEAEAAADVQRLGQGYRRVGGWTLPQTCNHLAGAIERSLASHDPSDPAPVIDPNARAYLDTVLASGQIPPVAIPPDDCDYREIDRLPAALDKLARCNETDVLFGRFGMIPFAHARRFTQVHVAHHLSHLAPT